MSRIDASRKLRECAEHGRAGFFANLEAAFGVPRYWCHDHVARPDNPAVFLAMANEIDHEVEELEAKLAEKQRVCDVQRESFRKMEADLAATRHAALGLWRRADALRLAGRAPSQEDLDEMAALLAGLGIEAS